MDNYDDNEVENEKIRIENEKVLEEFENYLSAKKLSTGTIKKHSSNISFFVNHFLLYEDPLRPNEGITRIDYFLGAWFIRKAMWSSVAAVKENISSLKHFFTYLKSIGSISPEELTEFKAEIKDNKDAWLEAMHQYDNPDTDF